MIGQQPIFGYFKNPTGQCAVQPERDILPLRKAAADAGKWKVIVLSTNGSQENLPVQGEVTTYPVCYDPLSQPSPVALTQVLPPVILELSRLRVRGRAQRSCQQTVAPT